jgi:hypothetical protein
MNMPFDIRPTALLVLALLLVVTGCGPTATMVSGVVTLDGEPLATAALMFHPIAGDAPTHHAFADAAGRYTAQVSPTKTSVTISLTRPSSSSRGDEPVFEQMVPNRYSDRATTVLVIEPVEGKNTVCDFALTTKP